MAQQTNIEWTESTWNPITGCDRISNGCDHCYAERMAARLQAMGSSRYRNGFDLTIHEDLFEAPLRWKQPRVIFVNSMSDLFHESIPVAAVKTIFATMNKASWHTFQILTKRPMHALSLLDGLTWTPNIWMGVSVESYRYTHRIEALRRDSRRNSFRFIRTSAFSDTRRTHRSKASTGRSLVVNLDLAPGP